MVKIRYYCQGKGEKEIRDLLENIQKKYNISSEIVDLSVNGKHNSKKEREIYERDFKPRAKILKKRIGKPITKLRSHKARGYYISLPGTIGIVNENGQLEWYTLVDKRKPLFENIQNKLNELQLK